MDILTYPKASLSLALASAPASSAEERHRRCTAEGRGHSKASRVNSTGLTAVPANVLQTKLRSSRPANTFSGC